MLVTARQFPAVVFRLGRCRSGVLSADRFLVHASVCQCRRDEGIHRQPRGRFRLSHSGIFASFVVLYSIPWISTARILRQRRARGSASSSSSLGHSMDIPRPRRWCACCCSWVRWASLPSSWPAHLVAGCDGRSNARVGADPRSDHGDGRRVLGLRACSPLFQLSPFALAICHHGHAGGRDDGFLRGVRLVSFQNDIKRVIAYSTCSQLGYMFVALRPGVMAYNAAMFHLFTHAFFKALLFLGCRLA